MSLNSLPVGAIVCWENAVIPDGWQVCNGTNGTPDLRGKFIRGASLDADVGAAGGQASHSHGNPDTGQRAAHDHGGADSANVAPSTGANKAISGSGAQGSSTSHDHTGSVSVTITAENAHGHTVGDTGLASVLPPNIRRVFIQRIEV